MLIAFAGKLGYGHTGSRSEAGVGPMTPVIINPEPRKALYRQAATGGRPGWQKLMSGSILKTTPRCGGTGEHSVVLSPLNRDVGGVVAVQVFSLWG
jgi:hypothetical protein